MNLTLFLNKYLHQVSGKSAILQEKTLHDAVMTESILFAAKKYSTET